jgi:hypothetical protein
LARGSRTAPSSHITAILTATAAHGCKARPL